MARAVVVKAARDARATGRRMAAWLMVVRSMVKEVRFGILEVAMSRSIGVWQSTA
jgi:hypothetical protein